MPGRRAKGEGGIYKRKDGRWAGQYTVDTAVGTKRKYVYGKTRKEAAAKLAAALVDRDAGLVPCAAEDMTLGQYLHRWLDSTRSTVRIGTWKQYEMIVRLHLEPTLGSTRLEKLNALQIQSLYTRKLEEGVAPRRVRYVHATIHKALNDAVRWQLVTRNVAQAVKPPRYVPPEINPLDAEQVKALLRAARGDKLEALYVLAVTTGMRIGEILGLKWSDLDLEAGVLRVSRTVSGNVVNPPKTASGRRTIRLTALAVGALRKREREGEWIFCSSVGTTIDVCNFHKNSWRPLLRRAGLPRARVHDLRHTAATLMLSRGVPVKVVSEMLGHSDVSITLSIYAHVLQICRARPSSPSKTL